MKHMQHLLVENFHDSFPRQPAPGRHRRIAIRPRAAYEKAVRIE